ncbi:MAG: hypothetical protein AVW06_03825 [Hadesarchaea archaeon DG-33-1]|nr:MAG: hypothetical protein AVW06_03825 [Hadesarchaea archaeon DG-33-1]
MLGRRSIMGIVSSADYDKLQRMCAREGCRISDIVSRIVSQYLARVPAEKVVKVKKIKRIKKAKKRAKK